MRILIESRMIESRSSKRNKSWNQKMVKYEIVIYHIQVNEEVEKLHTKYKKTRLKSVTKVADFNNNNRC